MGHGVHSDILTVRTGETMKSLLMASLLLAGCDGSVSVCNEYRIQQSVVDECSKRLDCRLNPGNLYTLERWKRRCEGDNLK